MRGYDTAWFHVAPASWEAVALGRLAKPVKRTNVPDARLLSLYLGEGIVPYKTDKVVHATSEDTSAYQLVLPGDLVLNNQQAWRGSVAVSRLRGIVSPAYVVCQLSESLDRRFAEYLFSCSAARFPYVNSSRGVGDIQRGLAWPLLKAQKFPVPPSETQAGIADYLDRETARIDELVAEQERLIELLRERLDAEADALFQSSKKARHTVVKRVLRPLSRPAVPGLGVVTAFRDGIVTLRSNRREEGYTFSSAESGYQEIRPGDFVFHALDGFAGAVGVSDSHGNATPVYHVCEAVALSDDLTYIARLLRHLGRSGFLATQAPNVRERAVDFRNWSTFGRLPIVLPPAEEQRRVAAHFDDQVAKINSLIDATEQFVELARERREALITAAVTGQIDVREMA
ncbi:restriction endonuclease subunit S [Actinomycetospora aeridis]|uniref:Restriction endonuclease subunit S n=1 Tax=Actinomycetospora aeridis TaxID=3129231 RepID=A0ABU8NFX9_9PSEU